MEKSKHKTQDRIQRHDTRTWNHIQENTKHKTEHQEQKSTVMTVISVK